MKNLLTVAFLSLSLFGNAQSDCLPGTDLSYIETANLLAVISNGGTLFGPPPGVVRKDAGMSGSPAIVSSAGLWLGAFDQAGNLKISAEEYPDVVTDFAVGPLNPNTGEMTDTICWHWNRLFRVTGSQISKHLSDFNDNGLIDNPIQAIYGWPAKNNPHFPEVYGWFSPAIFFQQLAPFHDTDGNGMYDPDKGDYPVVRLPEGTELVPAQIVWHVFNDVGVPHEASGGQPLGVEIQVTAFAFECEEPKVLRDAFFVQHKIINRSFGQLDSLRIGLFVDFDLGCYFDDYIGCNPDLHTLFVYNQDNKDGNPEIECVPGSPTFGDDPPAAAVTFLNKSLDKAMYNYSGNIDWPWYGSSPNTPQEYMQYLNARWKDGEPLTYGGDGHAWNNPNAIPTNHAYPDPPQDPNGWSLMNDVNAPYYARQWIGTHNAGKLLPNQTFEIVTAWSQHRKQGFDYLENVSLLYDEIELIRLLYDCHFDCVCSPVTDVHAVTEEDIIVFPNPVREFVTIEYGDLPVREIRLIAADGKNIQSFQNLQPGQTVLNVKGLNSGIYYLQIQSEQGSATKLVVIL